MWVRSLDQEDPLEKGIGNLLQQSCVQNPMDRGAWWAIAHMAAQSRTPLSTPLYVKVPPSVCVWVCVCVCVCVFMSLSPKTSEDRTKTNKNTTNKISSSLWLQSSK